MRTIGRHLPKGLPVDGRAPRACSYCGVPWHGARLRKDRSGNLSCPSCNDVGHDAVTLSEANARGAKDAARVRVLKNEGDNRHRVDLTAEAEYVNSGEDFS